MTCDDLIVGIHCDRNVESERFDALGQCFDLAITVFAWIVCIRLELLNLSVFNFDTS